MVNLDRGVAHVPWGLDSVGLGPGGFDVDVLQK